MESIFRHKGKRNRENEQRQQIGIQRLYAFFVSIKAGEKMATVASLLVEIGADIKQFQSGIENAGRSIDSFGQGVSKVGGTMTKWVTGPILAVGTGLLALAKKTSDTGDEIEKSAMKMGISTDALQEMRFASEQVGLESSSLDRALGRLNQRIGRAQEGNEKYQEALKGVGVSLEDVRAGTVTTEDAFMTAIQTLHEMENAQQQSAMASELFGTKLARDLMPAIVAGGNEMEALRERAIELGIVMDADLVKASAEFGDALSELTGAFKSVGNEVAKVLLPILTNQLIPFIIDRVIPVFQDLGNRVAEVIQWFSDLDPELQRTIGTIAGVVAGIGPFLVILGKVISTVGKATTIIGAMNPPLLLIGASIVALVAIAEAMETDWADVWQGVQQFTENAIETIRETLERVVERIRRFWDDNGEAILESAKETWDSISETIGNVLETISNIITTTTETIMRIWDAYGEDILTTAKNAFNAIADFLEPWVDAFIEGFNTLIANVEPIWDRLMETIESLMPVFEFVFGVITDIIEDLTPVLEWLRDIAIDVFKGVIDAVEPMADAVFDAIDFVIDIVKAIIALLEGDWGKAWEFAVSAGESARSAIDNVAEAIDRIVGRLVDRVVDFFNDMKDDVIEAVTGMYNSAKKWFGDMRDEAIRIVTNLLSQFVSKINELSGAVRSAISSAIDTAVTWLRTLRDRFVTWAGNIISGIRGVLFGSGIAGVVRDAINAGIQALKDLIPEGVKSAWDFGSSMVSRAGSAISGITSTVRNHFRSSIQSVSALQAEARRAGASVGNSLSDGFGGGLGNPSTTHVERLIFQIADTLEAQMSRMQTIAGQMPKVLRPMIQPVEQAMTSIDQLKRQVAGGGGLAGLLMGGGVGGALAGAMGAMRGRTARPVGIATAGTQPLIEGIMHRLLGNNPTRVTPNTPQGNIIIENMNVRSEQDIERIAQRLFRLQQATARAGGRN